MWIGIIFLVLCVFYGIMSEYVKNLPDKPAVSKNARTPTQRQKKIKNAIPTNNIDSFVAMGKSNGEAIRFDIKPDRKIEIEYQDASGDITRRKITAQIIRTAWSGLVIEAYCHLRQSQRSFKLENIRRLYENGHEINIVDWLEQIGFLQNRRVKKRIIKKKISDMVDKMPTSALDEFIKNSN